MASMRISVGSGSGSGSSRGSLQVPQSSAGYNKAHGHGHGYSHGPPPSSPSIPIESLVEHLLAAKRALSSMTAVLRAKELVTHARAEYEDAAILAAHAGFIRRAISDQLGLLSRMRQSFQITYSSRRRRFGKLTSAMDAAHIRLKNAMDELRNTKVQDKIRPDDNKSNLLDFLDLQVVDDLVGAMQKALVDLHAAQQSFDGDLLRFDNDIRAVQQALSAVPEAPPNKQAPELLASLVEHSGHMAVLLTSLNHHFDRCVTAVRITDGGTAVARRKAAEDYGSGSTGQVSISGYIAEQESHLSGNLDPTSPEQRDALMNVVISDATQVDDVVAEIRERLMDMEKQSVALHDQISISRLAHAAVLEAHRMLEDVEGRLVGYVAAENEFTSRWNVEQTAVVGFMEEMSSLHDYYQSYASAYASLVLEIKRRAGVEQRIEEMWRKTRENVDRLVEDDAKQREAFGLEAGEYLPAEMWTGIQHHVTRWSVVPVAQDQSPPPQPTHTPRPPTVEKRDRSDSVRGQTPALGHRPKRESISERPMPSPVKSSRSVWRNSVGSTRSSSGR